MSEMIHCFACGHKIHSSAKTCPSCGATQPNVTPKTEEPTKKEGWNWCAALFQGAYYAGKGKFGLGLLYAILGIFPLILVVNFFRLGSKANNDLTQKDFSWFPALFVGLINYIGYMILIRLGK